MSETLRRVQTLVMAGEYRVSEHAYEELRKDAILISDVIAGITTAELVEDYRRAGSRPGAATRHNRPAHPHGLGYNGAPRGDTRHRIPA
jgi:hypothetical protein